MDKQTSLKEIDIGYYVHKFSRLFWRWKCYIMFAIPISIALSFFSVSYLGLTRKPSLNATVLIGLDNNTVGNNWENFTGVYQNKERLLLNRTFLEKVVHKLALQLVIDNYSRYEIFDSVFVDSMAPYGKFEFEIDNINTSLYRIRYSNAQVNIKDKVVELGVLSSLKTLNISGIQLNFTKSFLISPYSFTFSVLPMRQTIDNILSRFKVTSPNLREQTYFFTATLEGTDYPLVSQVVNTIADMFVESNLVMRSSRMKENLLILQKQMEAAESQLSKSKEELRGFLSANPTIGLSQSTQLAMNEIINLESRTIETNNLVEQANDLKTRLLSASNEEVMRVISEVITLLESQGNLSASSIQLSLDQYQQERTNAIGKYDKSHPVFKEIESKLPKIKFRTVQALDTFIYRLRRALNNKSQSISKITSRMHGLPSKELQLAELQRRQEIDSEIFTSLLAKFNEAKVSEAAQRADVFIMDYAVQPIPPSPLKQFINASLVALTIVLVISFGLPVFYDLLDNTARTEQALVRLVPYRFLITLPKMKLIKSNKNKNSISKQKSKDKKSNCNILINDGKCVYPSNIIEIFRTLNTKIQLDLYDENDKSIVITSFDMEEGKSTVSANLAQVTAQHGIKTILLDCDMRKGVVNQIFDLPKSPGLSDYLSEVNYGHNQSSIKVPLQRTHIPNLLVIPSGRNVDNPQKMLSSVSMIGLKKILMQEPSLLIFDSPPIGVATDAAILSRFVSRFILVVRAGHTNTVKLRKVIKEDFPDVDNKIMGVILNMGETVGQARYYSY